jgi:hypothetical protein
MITFKTLINSIQTVIEPIPNYVTSILITVTGTTDSETPVTASINSLINFNIDTTQTDLKPYSELTEDEVLSWIDPILIESMKLCVEGQINSILNPPLIPKITPLPWE